MGSLHRHQASERVARVYDVAVGAQGDEKGMKGHVKAIRQAVGQADPNALGPEAFKARFGRAGKRKKKGPAKSGG
jgi:hypothetical protein